MDETHISIVKRHPSKEQGNSKSKYAKKNQEFQGIFKEEAHEKLSEHQDWDHKIPLEEKKKPTYGPINALSETELKALRKYLDKNL